MVSKVPASKWWVLLPEPDTTSTLPVESSTLWMPLIRNLAGRLTVDHWPMASL
jgi:hypothetical protein